MNLTEAISKIRPSIVQICFTASELSEELWRQVGTPFIYKVLGTAFFVNDEAFVITARHVIQGGLRLVTNTDAQRKNINISMGLPNSDNFVGNRVLVDFDVIDDDENKDLTLIKLRMNPFRGEVRSGVRMAGAEIPIPVSVPNLRRDRPREGEWIGISGYPFEQRSLVTNSGYIASVWTIPNYLADVEVNPGNSGGPVYLVKDSSIIGVCVASHGSPIWDEHGQKIKNRFYSAGLTQFVPSASVLELLDRNEIAYSDTDDAS